MARYWVAGATGFLGSHLASQLIEAGHEVTLVSRSGGDVGGAPVSPLDILDEAAVADSARGHDGAFLCAGKVSRDPADAEELHRAHVTGTRAALAGLAAAGVPRVVYASTSGTIALGRDPDEIFDETHDAPLELIARWPYYRTKLYAEREALEAAARGQHVVVMNPTLLLGPGDVRESSTGDVRNFLERKVMATPPGGLSFVDVRDAASALIAAMERGRSGERYLLSARNMTLAAFFQRLERVSGVKAPLVRLPKTRPLSLGASRLFSRAVRALGAEPPVDDVSVEMAHYYWYCDARKAEQELGFQPRDAGETLRDTVRDLIDRGVVFPEGVRELEAR